MSRKNLALVSVFAVIMFSIAFFLYPKIRQNAGNRSVSVSQENFLQIIPEPSVEDHVLWEGSDDIVVVEYFDIDCQYCRALLLEEDTLADSVKKNVRLIYRFFPLLDIYPHSLDRAIIAECVSYESGETAFFNFLRAASHSYQEHEEKNNWLIDMAKRFVGDGVRFDDCVSKRLSVDKINRSRAGGYAAGIFSVPSFLVEKKGSPVTRFDLLGPISGSRLLKTFAGSK